MYSGPDIFIEMRAKAALVNPGRLSRQDNAIHHDNAAKIGIHHCQRCAYGSHVSRSKKIALMRWHCPPVLSGKLRLTYWLLTEEEMHK
jgi:hypothetical protein